MPPKFVLTLTQNDIYFDQLRHPNSPLYNVGGYIRLGQIDTAKLTAAHQTLVTGQDIFGLRIVASVAGSSDNAPAQSISENRDHRLPLLDFSAQADPEAAANQWLRQWFETPMAIDNAPLFRAALLKISEQQYWYAGLAHHLAMDGWGFSNWASLLDKIYHGQSYPNTCGLWQQIALDDQQYLASKKYQNDRNHWQQQQQSLSQGVRLIRHHLQSNADKATVAPSKRDIMTVSPTQFTALEQLAEQAGVGISHLFLALMASYFAVSSGQSNWVFGLPFHNRKNHQQKQLPGVFTSVSPMAIEVPQAQSFTELARSLKNQQKANLRHQRYPIGHIINDFKLAYKSLYDIGFSYLKLDSQLSFSGYNNDNAELIYLSHNHEATPLLITIFEYGQQPGCEIQLDYNLAWFAPDEIQPLKKRFAKLLTDVLAEPEQSLAQRHLLPPLQQPLPTANTEQIVALLAASTSDNNPTEYQPASNAFEQQLVDIYAELLGLEINEISTTANFFELGGNSILSTLVVAQATAMGLNFSVQDLYNAPTIIELAALVALAQQDVGSGVEQPSIPPQMVSGTLPLLPMQLKLLDDTTDCHHFNQAVMLSTPNNFDNAVLPQIITQLIQRHDALRLQFNQIDQSWQAEFMPFATTMVDNTLVLKSWTEPTWDNLTAYATLVQQSLSPATGQLFKLVYIDKPGDSGRLLLVVHHLVIDEVSWRILLKDIETLYGQWLSQTELTLAAKTTSYQQWGEFLQTYGNSETLQNQREYWRASLAIPVTPLSELSPELRPKLRPKLNQSAADETGTNDISFSLSSSLTKQLLSEANRSYRTEMNELLLAGLFTAIQRWANTDISAHAIRLDLKGHGRQPLDQNLDLSQTVGWFSTLYPLTLTLSDTTTNTIANKLADTICAVKEQYRAVPEKGLGFGLLQRLNQELVFNYLGQFSQAFSSNSGFGVAAESVGQIVSTRRKPWHPLSLNGLVRDGRLSFTLTFDQTKYGQIAMQQLMDQFSQALTDITTHCCSTRLGRYSPSDFSLAKVTSRELNDWQQQYPNGIEDLYQATGMQQGMLFHSMMASSSYVSQALLRLDGLDTSRFVQAWQQLFERHGVFRTSFVGFESANPHQLILPAAQLPWQFDDLSKLKPQQQRQQIEARRLTDKAQGFDIAQAPLMRMTLLDLGNNCHQLIWSYHHALLDGWCLPLIFAEVNQFYRDPQSITELPRVAPYRDYVQWLAEQDKVQAQDWWREHLSSITAATPLPLASSSTGQPAQCEALVCQLDFSESHSQMLVRLAQSAKTTVNVLLQGAWALLLSRYSGQQQVVFGAVTSGRPAQLPGVDQMMGLFINTLPMVVNIEPQAEVDQWLQQLHRQLASHENHSHLPLFEIQKLAPGTTTSNQALFDSLMVFENYPLDEAIAQQSSDGGLQVSQLDAFEDANYGLTLTAHLSNVLSIKLEGQQALYNTKSNAKALEQISGHLQTLLLSMAAATKVKDIEMLSPAQSDDLKQLFDNTGVDCEHDLLTHQQFEAQVLQNPHQIALVWQNESLSYAELNARANQLAHYLIDQGVVADTLVGLCIERGVEMIVGLLAILKAGGAYVPMDPTYPQQRLQYMLQDTALAHLLTSQAVAAKLDTGDCQVTELDTCQNPFNTFATTNPPAPNDCHKSALAYVIYTSGSTGNPKGVMIEQQALQNFLFGMTQTLDSALKPDSSVLAITTIAFDIAALEIWGALCYGATLVLASRDDAMDPLRLSNLLEQQNISLMQATPATWRLMQDSGWRGKADLTLLCGGEPLPAPLAKFLTTHCHTLYNCYGPTETTVWSLVKAVDNQQMTLGGALQNYQHLVLDSQQRLVPPGVIGELYIGGPTLARGYLNQPQLTAKQFVVAQFAGSNGAQRWYKTGDLVRWLPNCDQLEFLGRVDHQVKIRGFRIELGEIEQQLLAQDQVTGVQVLAKQKDDKQTGHAEQYLVAYVTTDDYPTDISEVLRQALNQHLPDYMVPSAFVLLPKFELTPNGKIDRQALPEPDWSQQQGDYIAPVNEIEKQLCDVWQNVLGVKQVGTRDNYFALGGDSISVMKLVFATQQAGFMVTAKDIFDAQSVEVLAPGLQRIEATDENQNQNQYESESESEVTELYALPGNRHWYYRRSIDLDQWGQSFLLAFAGTNNYAQATQQTTDYLFKLHEGLRIQIIGEAEQRREIIAAADTFNGFEYKDLSLASDNELATTIADFQASTDLSQAMVKFLYCDLGEQRQDQLVVVMHHLAVEQYSMGIVINDFMMALNACLNGQVPDINRIGHRFSEWISGMNDWLHTDEAAQNMRFWQQKQARKTTTLPTDYTFNHQLNTIGALNSYDVTLSVEQTAQLQQVAKQLGYQEFDLILAAVARVLTQWSGNDTFCYELVTTGREHFDNMDLSGVVGWLNDYVPVFVEVNPNSQGVELVQQVSAAVKACTRHGKGFSQLKYNSAEVLPQYDISALYEPEFAINYIPRSLDHREPAVDTDTGNVPQQPLEVIRRDVLIGEQREAIHKLALQIATADEQLVLSWYFGQAVYQPQTIERLAGACVDGLVALMGFDGAEPGYPSSLTNSSILQPA